MSMRQPSSQLKRCGRVVGSGVSFKRVAKARSQGGASESESNSSAAEAFTDVFRSNEGVGATLGLGDPCGLKVVSSANGACATRDEEGTSKRARVLQEEARCSAAISAGQRRQPASSATLKAALTCALGTTANMGVGLFHGGGASNIGECPIINRRFQ